MIYKVQHTCSSVTYPLRMVWGVHSWRIFHLHRGIVQGWSYLVPARCWGPGELHTTPGRCVCPWGCGNLLGIRPRYWHVPPQGARCHPYAGPPPTPPQCMACVACPSYWACARAPEPHRSPAENAAGCPGCTTDTAMPSGVWSQWSPSRQQKGHWWQVTTDHLQAIHDIERYHHYADMLRFWTKDNFREIWMSLQDFPRHIKHHFHSYTHENINVSLVPCHYGTQRSAIRVVGYFNEY